MAPRESAGAISDAEFRPLGKEEVLGRIIQESRTLVSSWQDGRINPQRSSDLRLILLESPGQRRGPFSDVIHVSDAVAELK